MAPLSNTRVIRTKYADGVALTVENFKTETVAFEHTLQDGELLLRNLYLGLDPYIRFSFNDFGPKNSTIGQPVSGFGIAEVVGSKNDKFPVSSVVIASNIAWEQYTVVKDATPYQIIPDIRNPGVPPEAYLNVLGITGLTAWAAIETLAKFKKDDIVFISSAAGPVGQSLAIQAKRRGAFVIGSAGSDEKVRFLLEDLKIDAAFNYKSQDTRTELSRIAPAGLDAYLDLVGGETLDIAISKLKNHGHVIAIGNIGTVNGAQPYVTKNLNLIIVKALQINGFTAFEHLHRFTEFWEATKPLVLSGEIQLRDSITEGVEKAPQTFVDYLQGKFTGKAIVKVADL
ncbi:hypothetical protein BG003_006638 [Podila horticola]|nr:hypothetical protein BG003_006638 [Podila horticola]